MREILFRGKEVESSDWYYGDIFHSSMNVDTTRIHDYINRANVEIIPDTLGQYTGLTDWNGNKIFEGDIIQSYHNRKPMGVAVIYWQGSSFWCDLLSGSKYDCCDTLDEWDCECGIEIIGNIFDNKDIVDAREWSSDGEWLGGETND